MGTLLLVGFIVIIATVIVWYLEMRVFLRHMVTIDSEASLIRHAAASLKNVVIFLKHGMPLILDVAITLFLATSLGLASGVTGALIALMLSLGVSVIILRASRRKS